MAGAAVVLCSLWLSVVTFDISCVNVHICINGLNNQIEDYPSPDILVVLDISYEAT